MTTEVLFLMGPTASGKTDLAMSLYDSIDCDLISVDSALVYRELNIGTAKPTPVELQKYPHHLINIRSVAVPYSASQFRDDALACIEMSHQKGRLPVLVGGTMLYFKMLMQGIADLPSANPAIREAIVDEAAIIGWSAMHQQLASFDPQSASRIKPGDSQRIQRAIEVYRISGKTLSDFFREQKSQRLPYSVTSFALAPLDRSILRERIRTRFETMLATGLIEEVTQLMEQFDINSPGLKSVGYRQVVLYLQGEYDYQTMIEKAVVATSRLAKRQMTWLRSWPEVNWLETANAENLQRVIDRVTV